MNIYPPNVLSHSESQKEMAKLNEQSETIPFPTDEELRTYAIDYWKSFRNVVESHFSEISDKLFFYVNHPFETVIVKLGGHSICIGYKPSDEEIVRILNIKDFDPPLEYMNVEDIQKRLDLPVMGFDFTARLYGIEQADADGAFMALRDAMGFFWHVFDPKDFSELAKEILPIADVEVHEQIKPIIDWFPSTSQREREFDAIGTVVLEEPAGFRRRETWAFDFQHHRNRRISAEYIEGLKGLREKSKKKIDGVCVITSEELTSIGRSNIMSLDWIRVWDRDVLDSILHGHPEVLSRYFTMYSEAFKERKDQLAPPTEEGAIKVLGFKKRLRECPTGQKHFAVFEKIGKDVLSFLFPGNLGKPKYQKSTADGVERRDILFKNYGKTRFFKRIIQRFDADFIIVDPKNHKREIGAAVVRDVAGYCNEAVGRLALILSRKGRGKTCINAQVRALNKDKRAVLVVSDDILIEMMDRKVADGDPEDLLEDMLDELLTSA